ncbi:hypothetical protein JOD02_001005 [Caldicoprobacter guelmensis]|nr:ECF transporter S component [Caldicoprobacter guelmensis]MBM7582148.1 hypothetical protein [Caldicoprobacter guelmensis]
MALAVLFQSLRLVMPMPALVDQYVVGSLVNLCLIVAAVIVGIEGGFIVAVLTPVIAFLQGVLPNPVLVPFVALGNAVIVSLVALLYGKNRYVAMAAGALSKFLVLYITVVHVAIPLFMPNTPPQAKELLSLKFSWPQLVTASIGGILALIILPILEGALKRT